jgi:hypothetical protein
MFSVLDIQMLLQLVDFKEPISAFRTIDDGYFFNWIGVWISQFSIFWLSVIIDGNFLFRLKKKSERVIKTIVSENNS